jgi:soluble lytic murein transglycosylase-like protein
MVNQGFNGMTAPSPLADSSVNLDIIKTLSEKYQIPYGLVRALIEQESGNNLYAMRSEPSYRYLWDAPKGKPFRALNNTEANSALPPADFRAVTGSRLTEWQGQRTSWGPLQLMGAVARELGFRDFFPALAGPLGVEYSLLHLRKLWIRFMPTYGLEGVIAAYNAGSPRYVSGPRELVNQAYVDSVLKRRERFED